MTRREAPTNAKLSVDIGRLCVMIILGVTLLLVGFSSGERVQRFTSAKTYDGWLTAGVMADRNPSDSPLPVSDIGRGRNSNSKLKIRTGTDMSTWPLTTTFHAAMPPAVPFHWSISRTKRSASRTTTTKISMTRPKPSTRRTTPKPSTRRTTPKPSTIRTTPKPSTTRTTPRPSTTRTTPKPSTTRTTPKPSTTRTTPKPSTTRTTPRPSTTRTTPRPSTTRTTPKPSTTRTTPKPSTTRTTPKPSTTRTTPRPSTTRTTPKPSTTRTTPRPSTTRTTPKPSTTRTTPTPSTTRTTTKPSTTRTTPKPSSTRTPPKPSTTRTTPKPSTTRTTPKPSTTRTTPKPSTTRTTSKPSTTRTTPKPSTTKASTKPPTTRTTPKPSTIKASTKPPTTRTTPKPSTTKASTKPPTTRTTPKPSTIKASTKPPTTRTTPKPSTIKASTKPPTTRTTPKPSTIKASTKPPTPEITPTPVTPLTPPTSETPKTPPPPPTWETPETPATPSTRVSTTSTTPIPTPGPRFCNITQSNTYFTKCTNCFEMVSCLDGDMQAQDSVETCTYRRRRRKRFGCQLRCLSVYTVPKCCPGHWGDNCDVCPGGSISPCSGHGNCSSETGRCVCEIGFTGTACEKCLTKTKYGPQCSQDCQCVHGQCSNGQQGDGTCRCESGYKGRHCDQEIPGCATLSCRVNFLAHWRCADVNGTATCVCNYGFRFNPMRVDCVGINPCEDSPDMCGENSVCQYTGPGQHKCTCDAGYTGDGQVCLPIDPCQISKGGCEANSYCLYLAPNQHTCKCMRGFEKYKQSVGCTLTDVCTGKTCDVNAVCETVEPLKARCSCKEGYSGNGTVCHGNLLERIRQLNRDHPTLRNSLKYGLDLLTRLLARPLTLEGPFTLFLPVDRVFKNLLRNVDYTDWLNDSDTALQIIRQHMLIGQYSLEDLQKYDKFYTLQGNPAVLLIRLKRDIFKFKLHGSPAKAKVIFRDLPASNGMIHVVNNILTIQPEVKGNPNKNAMELIKLEVKYNRFQTLIASLKMESLFTKENITVFAPTNGAWDNLPTGTLDYLMKDEDGKRKLKVILENHIFEGLYGISTLINYPRLTSLANVQVAISVSSQGQVQLDSKANVTQANIPCSNGFYHHVSGILVPSYFEELLPNMCPESKIRKVKGPCGFCYASRCPLSSDQKLTRKPCEFWGRLRGRTRRLRGCSWICARKVQEPKCCEGFYGSNCIPCPGGHKTPCHDRGQCADSMSGNGRCTCNSSFTGTACEKCSQTSMYGSTCNSSCHCLYGSCDDGPSGKGHCHWGTCQSGFVGDDCDQKLVECGGDTTLCHAHSKCYRNQNESTTSCHCDAGYRGDGKDCKPIDFCLEQENGGCHKQASCQFLGPGVTKCTCNQGWYGDGFYCSPVTPCTANSQCHTNATCVNVEPGKYTCVCVEGFKGDGKECVLDNQCLVNNGGCDPMASCTPLAQGGRNCSCPDNTAGDGLTCYKTIYGEIAAHPNLTKLASLLKKVPTQDRLFDWMRVTFLAPSDQAMETFLSEVLSKKGTAYFDSDFNVDTFVSFHTLIMAYTTEDFLLFDNLKAYQTMYDGFSVHILNIDERLHIFANHSDFTTIVDANIVTTDGYIHVIDKVLEPFLPDIDTPELEDALTNRTYLSRFAQACKTTDIYSYVDTLDEYTIFVPTDRAFQSLNQPTTTRFLQYYMVPTSYIFTPSVTNNTKLVTALGPTHQLLLTIHNDRILVNGVPIIQSDILIDGGVIHVIDGLLLPILHRCDNSSFQMNTSVCGPCQNPEYLQCPQGFQAFSPVKMLRYKCFFNTADLPFSVDLLESGRDSVGCQQLCYRNVTVEACCSGYYGPDCLECPGGPEQPCGVHGECADGLKGNGTCQCEEGFTGPRCDVCERADMTGPHCNKSFNSCDFHHGNCSQQASCHMSASGPICRCLPGYGGDGYSCLSVCATRYNGGCHLQATCSLKGSGSSPSRPSNDSFRCVCNTGFYGNGTWCSPVINLCDNQNGGCDADRAICHFESPDVTDTSPGHVTCDCKEGFVGDGRMCNKDMMDALSRMKELAFFYKFLQDTDQNSSQPILPILADDSQKLTLFAPVSQDWNHLEASKLLLTNQLTILSVDQIQDGVWNFTSLGGSAIAITVGTDGQLLANGVEIMTANVETLTGIIHLTKTPIVTYDAVKVQASKPAPHTSTMTIIIVCSVIAIAVIVSITCTIMLVKSVRATGSFNIFKSFRSSSESTLSFARLNAQDEDSDSFPSLDGTKYDNPLFEEPDDN